MKNFGIRRSYSSNKVLFIFDHMIGLQSKTYVVLRNKWHNSDFHTFPHESPCLCWWNWLFTSSPNQSFSKQEFLPNLHIWHMIIQNIVLHLSSHDKLLFTRVNHQLWNLSPRGYHESSCHKSNATYLKLSFDMDYEYFEDK